MTSVQINPLSMLPPPSPLKFGPNLAPSKVFGTGRSTAVRLHFYDEPTMGPSDERPGVLIATHRRGTIHFLKPGARGGSRFKNQCMRKGFTRKPQGDDPAARVKNYITPDGLQRLKEEHRFLLTRERPAVTKVVAWAASNGDRSENGDYQYGEGRGRQVYVRMR